MGCISSQPYTLGDDYNTSQPPHSSSTAQASTQRRHSSTGTRGTGRPIPEDQSSPPRHQFVTPSTSTPTPDGAFKLEDKLEDPVFCKIKSVVGLIDRPPPAGVGTVPKNSGWFKEPFVQCRDGKVRRFPWTEKTDNSYIYNIQDGKFLDAHQKDIIETHAEFVLENGNAIYKANGEAITATRNAGCDIYKLGPTRYLIPQETTSGDFFACKYMFLLEHGETNINFRDSAVKTNSSSRQNLKELFNFLEKEGLQPLLHQQDLYFSPRAPQFANAWQKIANLVEVRGSCVLNMIADTSRMSILDHVSVNDDMSVDVTIRDPYHATYQTVKINEGFFQAPLHQTIRIQTMFYKPINSTTANPEVR